MDLQEVAERKAALRRVARVRRAALGVPVEAPGARLVACLAGLGVGGRVLAGYWPLAGEADPRAAMTGHGGVVCLPVVEKKGKSLVFRRWAAGAELRAGAFGVMEPVGAAVCVPEVVIVPLLAFDRRGMRLGYGGGFYDRTLTELRSTPGAWVLAIGLGFAAQEVAEVPTEPTDQPLDLIVTEREILPIP